MCAPLAYGALVLRQLSQMTVHDVSIRISARGLEEGLWQPPHNLESETLPEPHRPFVAADHEIELHRSKTSALCMFERMCAHGPCHSLTARVGSRHVAAICHMRPATRLIGAQKVGPEPAPILLGHKHLMSACKPKRERRFTAHLPRQRVGVAGANHRLQDPPDCIRIVRTCCAYRQHLF